MDYGTGGSNHWPIFPDVFTWANMKKSLSELCEDAVSTYGLPQSQYSRNDIDRYYRRSYLGYKLVHSRSGAMHMKVDGKENGQGQILAERLQENTRILEIGCGNGTNIAFLQQKTNASWAGIDISAPSINRAKKNCLSGTDLRVGSFEELPFEENSFDCVFAVETLCHANDRGKALAEAYRVLVPGGKLFIWDGWRQENLSEEETAAASLAERAMAVNNGATRQEWIQSARGFKVAAWQDYSKRIMRNTEDFYDKALFFVNNKKARLLLKVLPRDLRTNGVAALLIHPLLTQEVWEYGLLELQSK